jgi:hypothetical protein
MSLLRKASHKSELIVESYDAQDKTRIKEVSQNIDCFVVLPSAFLSASFCLACAISQKGRPSYNQGMLDASRCTFGQSSLRYQILLAML